MAKGTKKPRPFSSYSMAMRKRIVKKEAEKVRQNLKEIRGRLETYHHYEYAHEIAGMTQERFDLYISEQLKNPTKRSINALHKQLSLYGSDNVYQHVTLSRKYEYLKNIQEHYGQTDYRYALVYTEDWTTKDWEEFFHSKYYKEQSVYGSEGDEEFINEFEVAPMTAALEWYNEEVRYIDSML